jgi:hypothetical protein
MVCSSGACALSCQSGLTECNGSCRDLQSDRANCGGCNQVCNPGMVCSSGACALSCQSALTECDGTCRDLTSDRANCGACRRACDPGDACVSGACVPTCGTGLTVCSNGCVDTENDPANCGACAAACPTRAHSAPVCLSSACRILCDSGYSDCDNNPANGCETAGRCAQDFTPDAFSFVNQTGIAPSTLVPSNVVTPVGYDGPLAVSVTGQGTPQLSVAGGAWAASGSMSPGQTLQIRLTSSSSYSTTFTAAVTLGNYSTSWTVQTRASPAPTTFSYTGSAQTWTVPSTGRYKLEAWGAQGGAGSYAGGKGGYAWGEISLTGGQVLTIYVGGAGTAASLAAGGWNGGGRSSSSTGGGVSGSGGGASDVRLGGTALANRIVVGGGGGGASGGYMDGGAAGGLNGLRSVNGSYVTLDCRGYGGTQSAGGTGGRDCGYGGAGSAGSLGQGGDAANTVSTCGGGGGGYYGGGGGTHPAGGGGGSSYYGGMINDGTCGTTADVQTGNGRVVITPK